MAALRKASAYSKKKVRPYTRKSSRKNKAFIKAVPQNKIVKFNMGDKKIETKHSHVVSLISEEKVQVRDNSLESCRMFVNKAMDKEAPGNYYFVVKVFPHHILRENKIASGAGADRLSSGMTRSFGVTIGRAAIVPPGKPVFIIYCANEKAAQAAKTTLEKVKPKITCRNRVIFQKI